MPRYFRAIFVHLNLKLAWRYVRRDCVMPTHIASDLLKLIFKFDKVPYFWNS